MDTLVATPTSAPSAPVSTLVGPGRLLFERFIARLEHGDLKSLLELFAAEAEVLAFDGVRRGHAEVGRWLAEILVEQGPGVLVSTERFNEDGGVVRFEATITSPAGQVRQVYGVLVLDQDVSGGARIVRFLSGPRSLPGSFGEGIRSGRHGAAEGQVVLPAGQEGLGLLARPEDGAVPVVDDCADCLGDQ